MSQPSFTNAPFPEPECYRHPGRVTYIRCQRCGRPICPECMTQAAVGYQCPQCVNEGRRATRQNRAVYGGERSRNPATTSIVIIALNVVVWVAILVTGGDGSPLTDWLSLRPLSFCLTDPTQGWSGMGAQECAIRGGTWIPGVSGGAYWQVLTAAFTHVDVMHIGFNMLALWFLGPQMERAVGRARFLAIYLLSALTSAAAIMWLADPGSSTLGASGAIFGLMGALLVLVWKMHGDFRTVLIWLGLNVAFTFFGGASISWQGHLGGLLGGALVGAIIVFAPRVNRERIQWLGFAAVAVVCVIAIVARGLMLA